MKYAIPENLTQENFECENHDFISNMFTFSTDCRECEICENNNPDECWEKHITNELQFQCDSSNAIALEQNYHCENCNSKNIEVMPDENNYEITCNKCGHTTSITEEQIKEILKDNYTYLDMDELKQKLDKAITDDTYKLLAECNNVGRNDPCPCGSGKKYKQCHGK